MNLINLSGIMAEESDKHKVVARVDDTINEKDAAQMQSFDNSYYDLDQIHNFSSGQLNLTNHAIPQLGGTMNNRNQGKLYTKTNPLCNLSNISRISMQSESKKGKRKSSVRKGSKANKS